jgi:hypothetical protein
MGRVIIHAGMHKTGSSSIQKSLSHGISDERFRYFDLGEPNHSGPLVNLFWSYPEKYHGNRKRGRTLEQITDLRCSLVKSLSSQLESLGDQTGVISAEDICDFQEDELMNLREFIARFNHITRIVVYVRGIHEYIDSAFQQLIKGGLAKFRVHLASPNYIKLERLSRVFGRKNVSIIFFSRQELYGYDVVVDFANHIGLPQTAIVKQQTNESISLRALKFTYIYRCYGPGFGQDPLSIKRNNAIIARLSRLKGAKLALAPDLTRQVVENELRSLYSSDELASHPELINKLAQDSRKSFNVECEEDLLNLCAEDIQGFRSLCESLSIKCPASEDEYRNPTEVARLVSHLAPPSLRIDTSDTVVVRGTNQFLFLGGGRHSPLSYARGEKTVSVESVNQFWQNIQFRFRFSKQRTIAYRHIIIPDKHLICEDFFPEEIKQRVAGLYLSCDTVSAEIRDHVIYPLESLAADFQRNCLRVDTHLSVIGSAVCLASIAKSLSDDNIKLFSGDNIDIIRLVNDTAVPGTNKEGDLGGKLDPPECEVPLKLPADPDVVFYTNGYSSGSNGICDLYFNRRYITLGPRVVVFGDSYGRQFSRLLARFTGQVSFFRTPHMHDEIVNGIKPDIIITQNAERYLSKVKGDQARPYFFLYPWLKGATVNPSVEFANALNAVLSYGRPVYRQFVNTLFQADPVEDAS